MNASISCQFRHLRAAWQSPWSVVRDGDGMQGLGHVGTELRDWDECWAGLEEVQLWRWPCSSQVGTAVGEHGESRGAHGVQLSYSLVGYWDAEASCEITLERAQHSPEGLCLSSMTNPIR